MNVGQFDYALPPALIAQFPAPERTASRLLAVLPHGGAPAAIRFSDIGGLLRRGDLLVANNTRVVPARLFAHKPTGGRVEIMLERILNGPAALVRLRANKPIRAGQTLAAGKTPLRVSARRGEFFVVERQDGADMPALFESHGTLPLPPYIDRAVEEQDFERYQTVYSRVDGAVAAPTAGLHFDQALIDRLTGSGVRWATVTLHVGAGTFQPVRAESAASHRMHREWIEVDRNACEQINRAKSRGNRVIAVGTTVVRALESAARSGQLAPFSGDTDLFILPGHRFRVVDALITNFHLPRSTLLMLVCAFAGHPNIMRAYDYAIAHRFRFYSYGDAMFAEHNPNPPPQPTTPPLPGGL